MAQPLRVYVPPENATVFERLTRDMLPRPQTISPDTFFLPALSDSVAPISSGSALLDHLRQNAYLAASLDSLYIRADSTLSANLYLGPLIHWARLRTPDAENSRWLEAAGFRERLFEGKPLRYEALLHLQTAILEQAENIGHPFASVRLDRVEVDSSGGVSASLKLDRGAYFSFRELALNGNLRLPRSYLPRYLGLRVGAPYNRARVLRIRERLNALLFIETMANPTVTFAGTEAQVNLFLQRERANRFDFIIGLLPRPNGADGRLLLTGSASAALLNALNLGERLSLDLERLRPETQKLELQAGLPYLFGLPFGAEGQLHIFRRDSSWVDAHARAGIQYLLEGGDFIQIFWENKTSSLQKVDTVAIVRNHRLPAVLDLRQSGFGLETTLNRLDYRFNPRRGWALTLRGVAAFNTVLRNNQIEGLRDPADPEFRFSTLYDSVAGRATRYRLEGQMEFYTPILLRSTLKLALRSGNIFSEKPVYANEQYRLGGNKLLRGFDEESLFATRYLIGTLEFRLLLSQNAFLAAFSDYGYLENITDRNRLFLRPWGIGAGLSFETPAGIFGINIAVGRRDAGQSIDWRAPKFHLGYINLF